MICLEAEGKIAKSDVKLLNFLCPRKLDYEFLIRFDRKVARQDCWIFIWESVIFLGAWLVFDFPHISEGLTDKSN